MAMTPHDARKLRETFAKSNVPGGKLPDISVDGDQLEIRLIPDSNGTCLLIPINEDGDMVQLDVNNAILKRWRVECKEAVTLMRRVAAGESGTAYTDCIKPTRGVRR